MSRTNHHRRNYKRWNLVGERVDISHGWDRDADGNRIPRGTIFLEPYYYGNETWDLRFYAGCRRTPQVIHRVLDFYDSYAWRFHHGPGHAKSSADKWESALRGDTHRYERECRACYNAGYDVDDVLEPDLRPRSIEYDLW